MSGYARQEIFQSLTIESILVFALNYYLMKELKEDKEGCDVELVINGTDVFYFFYK